MSYQLLSLLKIKSFILYNQDIIILDEVHSTNQYLIENILYLRSGSVCLAECQTHGRGRYGKYWISPISNNVYLSIYWLFIQKNKVDMVSILGLVVSIVIGEFLIRLGMKEIMFKWPNDIYCKGRKLVGILVETVTKYCDYLHVIIGIGINITKIFGSFLDNERIIGLEDMGIFVDRNVFIACIINELYQSLVKFELFGFSPFFSRSSFLDSCYNQLVKLLVKDRVVTGIARGINNNGALLLECSGFIYSYSCVRQISCYYYQE